jgi:2-methylcitrate dehydratase PrpD
VSHSTLIERLAQWAAGLRCADIPERVVELAKCQTASVVASAHAGLLAGAGAQAVEAARAHAARGSVPIVGTGETLDLDAALVANAALGMTLDYDDYLFMGHTGHSAVWVSMLLGAAIDAPGTRVLEAQVAANEIAGRLGAACVLGPHNGQMWSHVHLAGAAVAAGKLLGLDAERLAHALGIAYAQPVFAIAPGFFGPGSKALTAAIPTWIGLQSARWASAGMTGAADALEAPGGFFHLFTYRPSIGVLSGLGSAWVMDTLAVKPYPGCAYIDTTIDVVLELIDRIRKARGGFDAREVRDVTVDASLLTVEMDRMSVERRRAGADLTPSLVNFDIPTNVAIALKHGWLGAEHVTEAGLKADASALEELSSRVRLRHEWGFTIDLVNELDRTLGADRVLGRMRRRDLETLLRRHRRDYGPGALGLGWREALRACAQIGASRRAVIGRLVGSLSASRWRPARTDLSGVDFRQVRMPFASRVTLRLGEGSIWEGQSEYPRGCTTRGDVGEVARAKLAREAGRGGDAGRAQRAIDAIWDVERVGAAEVLQGASG